MDIGKKIKTIRTEKLMTQSKLSGELITRNMLSQIENGSAQPSLNTVIYLAQRLGVPAGYLLSEGEEEFVYSKIRVMKNIKKAYLDRNYEWCREMCLSSFNEFDDELELILTDCCVGSAEDYIRNGRLYLAREMLDEAFKHAEKTLYSTVTQKNRAYIMFHLLKSISPALDSYEADTEQASRLLDPSLFDDIFCKYISLLCSEEIGIDKFKIDDVLTELDRLFVMHIEAKINMQRGDYKKAAAVLRSIMDGDTVPGRLLLYICCQDMEECCREMEDYKGAYEFSNNKIEILEHMLADV